MPFLEFLTRFRVIWEMLAPIVGLLFFVFKLLSYFGRRRLDTQPPSHWRPRGNSSRRPAPRWSSANRSRYGKRWSINDMPRP